MHILFMLLILGSVGFIGYRLGVALFKPVTPESKKRFTNYQDLDGETFQKTFNQLQDTLADKFKRTFMSEDYREQLTADIERVYSGNYLGTMITADRIRQLQLLYLTTSIIVCVLIAVFFGITAAGVLGVVLPYFAWQLPLSEIRKELKLRNQAIENELPEFYSMVYYTYRKSSDVDFRNMIRAYRMNCSDYFWRELELLYNDMRAENEEKGLDKFKKRVPLPLVTRFCEIMDNRLKGVDNLAVMENFKKEMTEAKFLLVDKVIARKELQSQAIMRLLYVPIALILSVYFYLQVTGAFKMGGE